MRILLALLTPLILTGCPAENPKSADPPATSETATVSTPPNGQPETPADVDYIGTWTTKDEQGEEFDIVVFPNGQVITNWSKGPEGARGERGFWRKDGNRLVAFYDDGWTDSLQPTADGFQHSGHAPGAALSAPATNQAPARKVEEHGFIGTWRLNKEPDGSYLYIALQSNGRAISTINGGTTGKWEMSERGAVCKWPDGWVDVIERTPEGWQKRSWVGMETEAPADLSPATRVGEARFQIAP